MQIKLDVTTRRFEQKTNQLFWLVVFVLKHLFN
jgi:hypothetical protein